MSILRFISSLLIVFLLVVGCSTENGPDAADLDHRDHHTYGNIEDVIISHLDLNLFIDFDTKQIAGTAILRFNNRSATNELILDTRDLTIISVRDGDTGADLTYTLGDPDGFMGAPLTISIDPKASSVAVEYQSSPGAAAVQWLTPGQTTGGAHPFLFTQSQAILARSWIPCHDTPANKITYSAEVQTPAGLTAVMSADIVSSDLEAGVHRFDMPHPIPVYLLALAVGELEYRALGPRSGVYAEPAVVASAAFEFAGIESMIDAAEALYGPYRWGKYDILVLPPSFPFGGMENARLTFATPTIIAGDRSLVSLIAHELAHSWAGNMVTNSNWSCFWLNEGFTTYFENRIMEAVAGKDYARMLAQLGFQDVSAEVEEFGHDHRDTHLNLDLRGRDPDEGFTNVAYEKGRLFLQMLEQHFGREKFDAFMRGYFDDFAFKSITSEDFVVYMRENLLDNNAELEKTLLINDWIYGPGIPKNCPDQSSKEFGVVEAQIEAWTTGTPANELEIAYWTTHHWLHFLRHLPAELTYEQLEELDNAFSLTASRNSEIKFVWFENTIRNNYSPADEALHAFLIDVGRRKFIAPLFAQLAMTDSGKEKALEIYKQARDGYHPVTYGTVDQILGYTPE